jgi:hypothetical protein
MLWRDSILMKPVLCLRSFLYLNGQLFLEIWEIFCYYFAEYIMYPLGLYLFFYLNAPDSKIWSFDGVTEFWHFPVAAFESSV